MSMSKLISWLSPTSGAIAVNKDPQKLSCTGKANEYHDLDDEKNVNDNDDDDDDDADNDGNDNDDDDDGEDSASSSDDDESDDDDDDNNDEDNNNQPSDGLSNYERLRLERIRRNQERLQQLGLQQFNIAPIKEKKKKKKKKVSIIGDIIQKEARSQPKRSVKKKLQHGELLEGGLNIPKIRLSLLGLTPSSGKKIKIKTNKHMYSKRYRCGGCRGCIRENDCETCIHCAARQRQEEHQQQQQQQHQGGPGVGETRWATSSSGTTIRTNRRCIFRVCFQRLVDVEIDNVDYVPAIVTTDENDVNVKVETSKADADADAVDVDVDVDRTKSDVNIDEHGAVKVEVVDSVVSRNDGDTNKDLGGEKGTADTTGAEGKEGVIETASGYGAATTVDGGAIGNGAKKDGDISAKKNDDADKVNGGGDEIKCCSSPTEEKKKNVDNWTSPMRTDNTTATIDTTNDDVNSNDNNKDAATAASAAPIKVDPPPKPRPIIPLSKQFDELDEFQEFLTTIPHGPMNRVLGQKALENTIGVVSKLISGKGITYYLWPEGIHFKRGINIHMGMDLDILLDEGIAMEKKYEDRRKGSLLRHPIAKMVCYKEWVLRGKPGKPKAPPLPPSSPYRSTGSEYLNKTEDGADEKEKELHQRKKIVVTMTIEKRIKPNRVKWATTTDNADVNANASTTVVIGSKKDDDTNNIGTAVDGDDSKIEVAANADGESNNEPSTCTVSHVDSNNSRSDPTNNNGNDNKTDSPNADTDVDMDTNANDPSATVSSASENNDKDKKIDDAPNVDMDTANEPDVTALNKTGASTSISATASTSISAAATNKGFDNHNNETCEFPSSCHICSKDGDLICCDKCDRGYHSNCHNPKIKEIPTGDWTCKDCKPKKSTYYWLNKSKNAGGIKIKKEKVPVNLNLFEGEHEDDCYICFFGGDLVCCDFCEKAFHCACHIPPLQAIPDGIWKCCECSAVERKKKSRCGECKACLRVECGKCKHCLDRPKFGGMNKIKQICIHKVCPYPRFAPPASNNPVPGLVTTKKLSKTSLGTPAKGGKKRGRPRKSGDNVDDNQTYSAKRAKTGVHKKNAGITEDIEIIESEEDDEFEGGPIVFNFKLSALKSAYMDPDSMKIRKYINSAVRDPDDYKAQDKTCEQLRKCLTSIDNAKKIVLFGGVEVICNAMKGHPDKSIVVAEASCTLSELVWIFPDISSKLVHVGAIDLIITAMNNWPNNSNKVLQMGCAALRALSSDDNNIKKIIDAGGLRVVLTSMERNPNRFEVQKLGCHFLQNIVVYSIDAATAISNSQVLPILIEAMSKDSSDTEFKHIFCLLIANLALVKVCKESVSKSGAIPVIIEALNSTNDVDVKQAACISLNHLATGSTGIQTRITKAGGLSSAFGIIESYSNDPDLLFSSLSLIKELCMSDEDVARQVIEMGGIKIILKVMETNPDLSSIQIAACSVIGYLVLEGRDEKYAPKLAKAIIAAMKNHSDVGEVQVQACDALFELSQVRATRVVLKEKKTQELLLQAKSHFKPCESDVDDIIASCERSRR